MADNVNVVGLFSDQEHLASAMRDLVSANFDRGDMRVIGSEARQDADVLEDEIRDLGAPDEDARFYMQKVQAGGQLLVVETDEDRSAQATQVIERFETDPIGGPQDVPIVPAVTTTRTDTVVTSADLAAPRRGVRSYRRL